MFDHDDAAGVIHTVTIINRLILTLYQRTVLIATLQCLACQKRSNIIRLRKERTCNDHAHIQCQLSVCHCVELVQPHTAFDMDGGTGVYINGVMTGTGNRANTIRACHGHVTAADQKCMGIRAFPFLPVQVDGKRAAVDHDLAYGRYIVQQLDGAAVAVLRRVQRRREGFVCTAIRAVRSCHRSGFNDRLVDREFHDIRDNFIVVLGRGGLGVEIIGVIAFLVETVDCSVFVDCGNDIILVLRIANYCLVLRIVICHRSIFLHTADGQQRQELFAHRAGRLGKRYGQIGIGLVDVAVDLKFFFARLELVLYRGFAD